MIAAIFAALTRHHTETGVATAAGLFASLGLSGIPSWIALITGAGAFFGLAALRSTATVWRGERNAEKAKAERLTIELAAEFAEHKKTRRQLEESEKKPDVHKLYDLLTSHDKRMAEQGAETAAALAAVTLALAELTSTLTANTNALTLWATEQAQKM